MEVLTPSFLKLLYSNIALDDQKIEQGGLQDAPGDFGAV